MTGNLWMRMKSLRLESVREFEDVRLEFKDGVNAIQIRNGYGKTTILDCLRWMFMNEKPPPEQWPAYKRSFGGSTDESKITLDVDIKDEDGEIREWTLKMVFDHKKGECRFETSSPEISGLKQGWHMPNSFAHKFRQRRNFTELFVFDGETAKELSKRQDHKQVEEAIREITGLRTVFSHFDKKGHCEQIKTEVLAALAVKDAQRVYGKWSQWLVDVEDQISAVEDELKDTQKANEDDKARVDEITTQLGNIPDDKETEKELKKIRAARVRVKGEIKTKTTELLGALTNPVNLDGHWDKAKEFNLRLYEKRIPEGVGRPFFMEILEDEECVCGTPWDEGGKMRQQITEKSERYLGDVVLSTIKSMQTEIREAVPDEMTIEERCKEIDEMSLELVQLDSDMEEVEGRLDEESQERREKLKAERAELEGKIRARERTFDQITETDPNIISVNEWDNNIRKKDGVKIQPERWRPIKNLKTLREVKRQLISKLDASSDTTAITGAVDFCNEITMEALEKVMVELRARAEDRANDLLELIPATGGGISVRLSPEGVKFVDEYEREQTGANIGAILSAAYCFVSSMSELGSVEVPLFADSPITGMDNFSSEGWTEAIWPMFPQMIFMITPAEKVTLENGPKGEARERLAGKKVSRMTVKRADESMGGEPQTGKMEVHTDDETFWGYAASKRANK